MKTVFLLLSCMLALAAGAPEGFCGGAGTAEAIEIGAGYGFVWSPAGDKLAFISGDTVFVYSLVSGVRTVIGHGAAPHWSPTGDFLAFQLKDMLQIHDFSTVKTTTHPVGPSFGYAWTGDWSLVGMKSIPDTVQAEITYPCRLVYLEYDQANLEIRVDSQVTRMIRSLAPPRIESSRGVVFLRAETREPGRIKIKSQRVTRRGVGSRFASVEAHYPVLHAGGGPFYRDTSIWLFDTSGRAAKQINPVNSSFLPVLSPDGLLVLVADVRGHTTVFDTSGTLVADVADGEGPTWGHDSRYFIFKTTQQSEWDITGGDMFFYSIATRGIRQLTYTPDIPEFGACVSPDGHWIAFMTREKGISLIRLEEQ